jgi:hypothetical protein
MRCRSGDIARLETCGIPSAIGLLVSVEAPLAPHPKHGPMWRCRCISGAKSDQGYSMPGDLSLIPDAWLRPLRDDPGADEVLIRAGLPEPLEIAHG